MTLATVAMKDALLNACFNSAPFEIATVVLRFNVYKAVGTVPAV